MIKGFIDFNDGKIPFVIENYRMDLFTDDTLLTDFCHTYNFKNDFIIEGQIFDTGMLGRKTTFFVEHMLGDTCYLRCYIMNLFTGDNKVDSIGFQSPYLDALFRYNFHYFDLVRNNINLALNPSEVYKIPFHMDSQNYDLLFRIGHDNRLGLIEDLDRKGEILVPLHTTEIQECYNITIVLYRLAMFMSSNAEVPFKRITIYNKGMRAGWFYCPLLSQINAPVNDVSFQKFNVMKYIPDILNNIATDSGNRIEKSIPLGHLGSFENMFSPHRFMEQIMAFEYLFDKLEHRKAQDRSFPLKMELENMFNEFSHLLLRTNITAAEASEQIKKLRHSIAHGHSYYYDFKDDHKIQHLMLLLDKLIKCMSLKWIGFSNDDILNYEVL